MQTDIHEIQPGWEVCDEAGERIGEVRSVGPDHVRVKTDGLFSKDYYVPASVIDEVEERRVEITVPKKDIGSQGWDRPPAGTSG
jgi:hypothetical protein